MKTIKDADLQKALRLTDGDIKNMIELLKSRMSPLNRRRLEVIWNALAEDLVPRTSRLVKLIRLTLANSIELEK